jgi:hypothetical protein
VKELLYIPDGIYCKFKLDSDLVSYEKYNKVYFIGDIREFLAILQKHHGGWADFIYRNNLPNDLTVEMFEVVER